MIYEMRSQARIRQLKKLQADIPSILRRIQKDAMLCAVEAAEEATPPLDDDDINGTHTITGELKSHWRADSEMDPKKVAGGYRTILRNGAKNENDTEYASYVNDGHRLKRHFVPGLYINKESGHIEYDPQMAAEKTGGMMVGTETTYVNGYGMTDAAKKAYEDAVLSELDKVLEELRK